MWPLLLAVPVVFDFVALPASAQTARVIADQEISSTTGGFGASLADVDLLGVSVAALGDLDGAGSYDLFAGVFGDDDGGLQRGAVYTLFLGYTWEASATFRTDSQWSNAPNYFATPPALGTTWTASVNNVGSGNLGALVAGFARPLELFLPGIGDYLLVDPTAPCGESLHLGPGIGTDLVSFSLGIPPDIALVGVHASSRVRASAEAWA